MTVVLHRPCPPRDFFLLPNLKLAFTAGGKLQDAIAEFETKQLAKCFEMWRIRIRN